MDQATRELKVFEQLDDEWTMVKAVSKGETRV